jgi:uncharacterized protein YggE
MKNMARLLCGLMAMSGLAAVSQAQQIEVNKNNRTIAITTTDQAIADADIAVVHIGFQVFAPDAKAVYALGSKSSNAISEALKSAGIFGKAIQSDYQGLRQTNFDDKATPEERTLRAYTLSQSWTVRVPAADAAKTLHLAVEAGANDSGQIEWELSDTQALQGKAAEKALTRARGIAEQMAKGLGVHLDGLVYASNQVPNRGIFAYALNTESASVSAKAGPQPEPLAISPKPIEESATVYAVFAIE